MSTFTFSSEKQLEDLIFEQLNENFCALYDSGVEELDFNEENRKSSKLENIKILRQVPIHGYGVMDIFIESND